MRRFPRHRSGQRGRATDYFACRLRPGRL
jgi:hypothetical protein